MRGVLCQQVFYFPVELEFRFWIIPGVEEIVVIQGVGIFIKTRILVLLGVGDW